MVAVNETAKILQRHTVTELLPGAFTLRSRGAPWWKPGTRMGFNIKFAGKSQVEPVSILGSRADWLLLQEKGGIKQAGGHSLAIPRVGAARPKETSVVPARSKPRRLLGEKRAFVMTANSGKHFIASRRGKKRLPLKIWYAFKSDAHIDPILRFGPTESQLANKVLPVEFQRALARALATAK